MKKSFIALLLGSTLIGCSGTPDVSHERSPSATGPDVKSTGPATPKVDIGQKMQKVGQGDGLVRVDGK